METKKHNAEHGITKVVFRKWANGDILALFPEVPADAAGHQCQSYEHVGQHGGADYFLCLNKTRPAQPNEYQSLKSELEAIGYCLQPIRRACYRDHRNRQELAKYQD
jgi:hypothetical protein